MLDEEPGLVHRHSPDGWGVLHIGARYADPDMLELFLSRGADVNDNINHGRATPLFFSHQRNAEFLLANGADIDARSKNGFTVLHCAAKRGDIALVDLLLAHGACADLQTDGRQSAWALAVRGGHRSVADRL